MASKADEARVLSGVRTELYLGGEWTTPRSGSTVDVADGTAEDGLEALTIAAGNQPGWAATAPRDRAEILRRAYELMVERADDLALLMTLEMGKPLSESRGEVTYAAEFLRWFSEE